MKQFALKESTAIRVLSSDFAPRKSGKRKVPSVRMVVEMMVSNLMLDQLRGPAFRHAFYGPVNGQEVQKTLVDSDSDTPVLLLDNLKPIRMTDELTGYTATIDIGLGRKESQVELSGAKLDKFEAALLGEATVRLKFRISAEGLNKRAIGELGSLVGCDTALLLEPPAIQDPLTGLEAAPGTAPENTKADVAEDTRHRKTGAESKISRFRKKIGTAAKKAAARKKARTT